VEGGRFSERIQRRAAAADLDATSPLAADLARYLDLLARWNRRINLTAFDLDSPSDEAIDRLIVEPWAAAGLIRRNDQIMGDVGSGGGSPAIPIKLAVPHIRLRMIEARARKSAFLREAIRVLELQVTDVVTSRLEDLPANVWQASADVVTLRAVRSDASLWARIRGLLKPGGRVLWFTGGSRPVVPDGYGLDSWRPITSLATSAHVAVLTSGA